MNKPILGISMGDPFGNGPEITVKALSDKTIYDRCRPVVIGDVSSMEYAAKVAKNSTVTSTVKNLKKNTSYKFRIRAYKTIGKTTQYSSWSGTLTVKTKK